MVFSFDDAQELARQRMRVLAMAQTRTFPLDFCDADWDGLARVPPMCETNAERSQLQQTVVVVDNVGRCGAPSTRDT